MRRAVVALLVAAGLAGSAGLSFGCADPDLSEEGAPEPTWSPPPVGWVPDGIVEDTRVPLPGELEHGVEFTQNPNLPTVTPRECPECFLEQPPVPSPPIECAQRPIESGEEVSYEGIEADSTDGWPRYSSPHHALSFSYPPDWAIEIRENDVYFTSDAPVTGPPTEIIKLFNPDWRAIAGLQPEGGIPAGASTMQLVYQPVEPGVPCLAADHGNPRRIVTSVGGVDSTVTLNVVEPEREVVRYVLTFRTKVAHPYVLTMQGIATGTPSDLSVFKAIADSISFEQ